MSLPVMRYKEYAPQLADTHTHTHSCHLDYAPQLADTHTHTHTHARTNAHTRTHTHSRHLDYASQLAENSANNTKVMGSIPTHGDEKNICIVLQVA